MKPLNDKQIAALKKIADGDNTQDGRTVRALATRDYVTTTGKISAKGRKALEAAPAAA